MFQVHGEVTDPGVDIFDREKVFLDTVLRPLIQRLPMLKVVMEHITTAHAVRFVESCKEGVFNHLNVLAFGGFSISFRILILLGFIFRLCGRNCHTTAPTA